MSGWQKSWLVLLINLATILTTLKVLSDLVGAWLRDSQQKQLKAFLERWQTGLEQAAPESLLNVPIAALANVYERALGAKPFSGQAFRRTCAFSCLFLGASLGFTGLLSGKPFGMNLLPWESFMASTAFLKAFVSQPSARNIGDAFYIVQNASDLANLGSWPFAIGFTFYFVMTVVLLTAFLVSISTAVSRLFLNEMLQAQTSFRVFILFLSNTLLLLIFGATACLLLFVLLNPWAWPFVPLLFGLSTSSIVLGAGVASAASLAAWFFSAPWLREVLFLALFPSLLLVVATTFALVTFPFRGSIQRAAARVLKLSLESPRGVFAIISSSSVALAFCLGALASLSAWLARLSLSVGAPKYLGVDPLVLSLITIAGLLCLGFFRARTIPPAGQSAMGLSDVFFLFFGTLCLVVLGYYIQAIIECYARAASAGVAARGVNEAILLVEALTPGAFAGYFVLVSKAASLGFFKVASRVFVVLTANDLFGALHGLSPYRDFVFSTLCNAIGAFACALVILRAYAVLFCKRDSREQTPFANPTS